MNGYAQFAAPPLKTGTFVQFGRGMSDQEIIERIVASYSEHLTEPVHTIPPVRILPAEGQWPRRGVLP